MYPLGRIANIKGDKLETDWEVDEVEIKIVQTKVFQTLLTCSCHMLRSMEGVPQLGGDKQVFPLTNPSIYCSLDALTNLENLSSSQRMYFITIFPHLFLISIVTSTINMFVAKSDHLLYQVSCSIFLNLPASKSNSWQSGIRPLGRSKDRDMLPCILWSENCPGGECTLTFQPQ
jgi:hypothetical protein